MLYINQKIYCEKDFVKFTLFVKRVTIILTEIIKICYYTYKEVMKSARRKIE